MLNSTGYYKHILKCSEQMEDGRMILFDPDSGKTHVLNATAVKIYRLCTNTEPEGIALSILEEGMDVDKEVILEDVCDTIQKFVELNIIAAI